MTGEPLLSGRGLSRTYRLPAQRRWYGRASTDHAAAPALTGVDIDLLPGESVGLVGRSGSGKSTLLRLLLALESPDAGTVTCEGAPVRPSRTAALRWFRRVVQYVPQDPGASLDPRGQVADLVREPLTRLQVPGTAEEHRRRARECLDAVGLGPALDRRRPSELSGGQRQRVAVARAIAPRPRLLVADEPVSGLDLPLRAQVVATLAQVCAAPAAGRDDAPATGLLLVSHDLSVVAGLCRRTLVMHEGRVVEDRSTEQVLADPQHPQTRLLLDAVPALPAVGAR